MTKVLVMYESDYGNTQKMAQAIEEGAKSVDGTTVTLKPATDVTADDMIQTDAVIMGSPVHMGGMDCRIKTFIDKVCGGLWMQDKLVGKVGAVFSTGSGFGGGGGGAELTMLSMLNNLAELGMVIVPLPKSTDGYPHGGLQWGPYARTAGVNMEQDGIQASSLVAAKHHGAHVAKVAAALKDKAVFS